MAVLILGLLPLEPAEAALSFSDTLSDVRPNVVANHELKWSVSDAGGITEGESFTISFASQFNTANIVVGDVDLFDDAVELTLATNCSGSEKASYVNNGDDTFTFTICPGDGGAISTPSVVTLKIGTNASGGSHQITNPSSAGGYIINLAGSGGYTDSSPTQVVVLSGTNVTATVGALTGDLRITGYASPGAVVFFLESGGVIGSQVANSSSFFDKTFTMSGGLHAISIYASDVASRLTLTITFNVNVTVGVTTIVSGIILPPTIAVASPTVKRPAALTGQGMAKNYASVQVFVSGSGDSLSVNIPTNEAGQWSTNVNPKLHLGNKSTYSIALDGGGGVSEFSQTRLYDVLLSADLNVDNLINLTDFSILMFNYGTATPPNVVADINDNGPVDLVDFSVMMYYWTGG
jgi:hypothetical protein